MNSSDNAKRDKNQKDIYHNPDQRSFPNIDGTIGELSGIELEEHMHKNGKLAVGSNINMNNPGTSPPSEVGESMNLITEG